MTQGLQHILQLLFIHGHGQVGDVQVGGVLLLLLQGRVGGGGRGKWRKGEDVGEEMRNKG